MDPMGPYNIYICICTCIYKDILQLHPNVAENTTHAGIGRNSGRNCAELRSPTSYRTGPLQIRVSTCYRICSTGQFDFICGFNQYHERIRYLLHQSNLIGGQNTGNFRRYFEKSLQNIWKNIGTCTSSVTVVLGCLIISHGHNVRRTDFVKFWPPSVWWSQSWRQATPHIPRLHPEGVRWRKRESKVSLTSADFNLEISSRMFKVPSFI